MVSTKTTDTRAEMAQGAVSVPEGRRPWEDRTLSAAERYQSYYDFARSKVEAIRNAGTRPGVTEAERTAIRLYPEVNFWVDEFRQLKGESPEAFCERVDRTAIYRALLGKNYLGAEVWSSQGIKVAPVPPLPGAITEALLHAECPLHPGEKIKDTHLLVLVPQTVNGEPYSALKLRELCATRKGSGDKLIFEGTNWATSWTRQPWASRPQAESEWVLLPKSEPDPTTVPKGKDHFRSKDIAAQQKVHDDHYQEYREVKTVELMTAALLFDLAHKERLLSDHLRCEEPNAAGGRVYVGCFLTNGLEVNCDEPDRAHVFIGRALARKL